VVPAEERRVDRERPDGARRGGPGGRQRRELPLDAHLEPLRPQLGEDGVVTHDEQVLAAPDLEQVVRRLQPVHLGGGRRDDADLGRGDRPGAGGATGSEDGGGHGDDGRER
jgi:hypothetical protein